MVMAEQLMDAAGVARYLNVHPRTVARLTERGELTAFKVGGHGRFRKSDVDAYLEKTKPKPKKEE